MKKSSIIHLVLVEFRLSTKFPTLWAVFLCTLSVGTAPACSLRLVLFPQELAQITVDSGVIVMLNKSINKRPLLFIRIDQYKQTLGIIT